MVVKYTFSTVKQYMDACLTTLKFWFFFTMYAGVFYAALRLPCNVLPVISPTFTVLSPPGIELG